MEGALRESGECEWFVEQSVRVLASCSGVARKWVQSWNAERAGPKEVRRVAKDKLLAELKGVIQAAKSGAAAVGVVKQVCAAVGADPDGDLREIQNRVLRRVGELSEVEAQYRGEISQVMGQLTQLAAEKESLERVGQEVSEWVQGVRQLASSCGVVVSEDGSLMEAVDGLALYLEKQREDQKRSEGESAKQVGVLAKRVQVLERQCEQMSSAAQRKDEEVRSRAKRVQEEWERAKEQWEQEKWELEQEKHALEQEKEAWDQLKWELEQEKREKEQEKRIWEQEKRDREQEKRDREQEKQERRQLEQEKRTWEQEKRTWDQEKRTWEQEKRTWESEKRQLTSELGSNSKQQQFFGGVCTNFSGSQELIDKLTEKIDEKERSASSLGGEVRILQQKAEDLASFLKRENEELQQRVSELAEQREGEVLGEEDGEQEEESRVKELEERVRQLMAQIEEKSEMEEIRTYELKKKEAESKLTTLQVQLNHEITQKKSLQQMIEKQAGDIQRVTGDLLESGRQLEQLRAQLSSERAKWLSEKTELNNKNSRLKIELTELQKEKEILDNKESKLKDFESEDGFYQTQLSSLQAENKQLLEQLARQDMMQGKQVGAEFESIKQEAAQWRLRAEELQNVVEQMQEKLSKDENPIVNNDVEKAKAEVGQLKREVLRLQEVCDKLKNDTENEVNMLKREVARLQEVSLQAKVVSQKNEGELKREIARLSETKDTSDREIARLQEVSRLQDSAQKIAEKEVGQLKLQIARLEGESSQLTDRLKQEIGRLQEANQKAKTDAEKEATELKKEIAKLKEIASQSKVVASQEQDELKRQIERVQEETQQNAISEMKKLSEAASSESAELRREIVRLQSVHNEEVLKLDSVRQRLEAELQLEKKRRDGTDAELRACEARALELQGRLAEERTGFADDIAKQQGEIERLLSQLQQCRGDLDSAQSTIGELRNQSASSASLSSEASVRLGYLEKQLKEARNETEARCREVESLRGDLATVKKELNLTRSKCEARESDLAAAQSRVESLERVLEQLRSAGEEAQKNLGLLRGEVESRGRDVKERERQLTALQSELEHRSVELVQRGKLVELRERELALARQEVAGLKASLTRSESAFEDQGKRVVELQGSVAGLECQLGELRGEQEREQRRNAEERRRLGSEVESLRTELARAKKVQDDTKGSCESLQKDLRDMGAKNEELSSELSRLRALVQDLEAMLHTSDEEVARMKKQGAVAEEEAKRRVEDLARVHGEELKRREELCAQEVRISQLELGQVKKDFSKQVSELTREFESKLKAASESERRLQLQVKELGKQVGDKEDEVGEVEDELLRRDGELRSMQAQCDARLAECEDVFMRQVESLRKERDAAAAALAVAQRRAYEDAEQARKAIERMKECEQQKPGRSEGNEELLESKCRGNFTYYKIELSNQAEQIKQWMVQEEKYAGEVAFQRSLVGVAREIVLGQPGNVPSLKEEQRAQLEEFKQELLAAWRQRVEAGGGGGIVAAKEVQQEQPPPLEFQPDEMGSAHGSLANDFSGIFPIVEKEVQVEKPEEQPLMKKMEELIERLSLKELEINKLNELARQQKHKIMDLQKISVDPQAYHTKIHLKENFKRFLEACGQKTPDRNIADILLNNLFQFFEVTEQEKEELLTKMAAKPADKKKGFVNLLFPKK